MRKVRPRQRVERYTEWGYPTFHIKSASTQFFPLFFVLSLSFCRARRPLQSGSIHIHMFCTVISIHPCTNLVFSVIPFFSTPTALFTHSPSSRPSLLSAFHAPSTFLYHALRSRRRRRQRYLSRLRWRVHLPSQLQLLPTSPSPSPATTAPRQARRSSLHGRAQSQIRCSSKRQPDSQSLCVAHQGHVDPPNLLLFLCPALYNHPEQLQPAKSFSGPSIAPFPLVPGSSKLSSPSPVSIPSSLLAGTRPSCSARTSKTLSQDQTHRPTGHASSPTTRRRLSTIRQRSPSIQTQSCFQTYHQINHNDDIRLRSRRIWLRPGTCSWSWTRPLHHQQETCERRCCCCSRQRDPRQYDYCCRRWCHPTGSEKTRQTPQKFCPVGKSYCRRAYIPVQAPKSPQSPSPPAPFSPFCSPAHQKTAIYHQERSCHREREQQDQSYRQCDQQDQGQEQQEEEEETSRVFIRRGRAVFGFGDGHDDDVGCWHHPTLFVPLLF